MKKLRKGKVDTKFLAITLTLLGVGVLSYISASLSIYTEDPAQFWSLVTRHIGLGVIGGSIAMYVISNIDYQVWKRYALILFLGSVLITFSVFIPGLGFSHGGATRWISLGFISFQPAEFLKLGAVIFLSAWLAKHSKNISTFKYGLLPFLIIIGVAFSGLVFQPDTSTMALIGMVTFSLYWLRGASFKHILVMVFIVGVFGAIYTIHNPYIIERIKTFNDAAQDPYGSSYQIRQSKIAIGSGKLYGRGLGQSIHKFGPYLPESNSDSIFAIFAEEWGFLGSLVLIVLYVAFGFLGLRVARKAPTAFGQNVVIGIILIILVQVFLNIAAISGIIPLSGLPLIFMSHGGTALFVTLSSLGIVLNVSRFMRIPSRSQSSHSITDQ